MKQPSNWTDPDAYEIFMGRWSELLAKPFLAFAGVTPGGCVLDVACGTGVLTKALADAGAHVIGVDASEGYLEGAHRRRSHPNITYELGDIRRMRFEDDSFDAAVSTLALDVLPEIEQVVTEMKRVTKPGGVVASGVHQFFGGMPAFDLVQHTGAVLDASMNEMRTLRGRPLLAKRSGRAVEEVGACRCDGSSYRCRLRVCVLLGLLGYVHERPRPFRQCGHGTLG
jgi:SAM-dependent methyltransferase